MTLFSVLRQWLRDRHPGRRGLTNKSTRRRTRKLQFAELEPREMLSGYHFDFNTSSSPTASGYVGVPVVGYSSSRGYGWTNTSGVSAVDRATSNPLTRDFHTATDRTFQVDLPNGIYQVTPTMGDSLRLRDEINVYVNGTKVASGLTTQINQFIAPTYTAAVTNGHLQVRLADTGGATSGWALDGLDVNPAPLASNAGPDQSASEGSTVSFTGAASGTAPLMYLWRFGDGTTASGTLTPTHVYNPGVYQATLTVTDATGMSATDAATITVSNVTPKLDALGPYAGAAGTPLAFVGIARDPGPADQAGGLTFAWKFGDGTTAAGAMPSHVYAAAGSYTVTLTVTDTSGAARSTTTTATIGPAGTAIVPTTEYQIDSTNLLANTLYGYEDTSSMASDGAWSVNADWESGKSSTWYIEQQRYGADLIISGIVHNNTTYINDGFKVFDWGFAHQASDGSFAGTGDAFHSTSFFVEAVAHACLVIEQSPYAATYQAKVNTYAAEVYKAAKWMAGSTVWSQGLSYDSPYTHRRYLVADALGLTSLLVGGDSDLMAKSRYEIQNGLSLQWANGVNPEEGGYDSSYQNVGLTFAERWAHYFPTDSLTPSVNAMINLGLTWEETMILATGEISCVGNTRTGVETGVSGSMKKVDWKNAVDAFAYWYQVTGNQEWQIDGRKIAQFYFTHY